MDSVGGITSVQSRIAEIRSRYGSGAAAGPLGPGPSAPTPTDVLGALGASTETSGLGSDFESRLREILNQAPASPAAPTTPAPTSGELGPSGVDHVQFGHDLLRRLGMPETSENIRLVDAWARAEGTRARFNPLATTQGWEGATHFNSVGVRNYASYEDGLEATVKTITNGRYQPILDALRAGNDAVAVARAIAASPWGSGEGVLRVLGAA